MTKLGFMFDDGGRAAAGFKGSAGDCVTRAVCIASGLSYAEVYAVLSGGQKGQRKTKRSKARSSARSGVSVKRKWFRDYMTALGWEYVPTMGIGTGCKVHLTADELPAGRLIVQVSNHYTTMIDGVIHDTYDPRRDVHCIENYHGQDLKPGQWLHPLGDRICWIQRRCVYGYWRARQARIGKAAA